MGQAGGGEWGGGKRNWNAYTLPPSWMWHLLARLNRSAQLRWRVFDKEIFGSQSRAARNDRGAGQGHLVTYCCQKPWFINLNAVKSNYFVFCKSVSLKNKAAILQIDFLSKNKSSGKFLINKNCKEKKCYLKGNLRYHLSTLNFFFYMQFFLFIYFFISLLYC